MKRMQVPSTAIPAELAPMIKQIFSLGQVGYIALGIGHRVVMQMAPGVETETSQESNYFEELLVNPSVLELVVRRGTLDCGGVDFVAVGYGHFVQILIPLLTGHASLGVARQAQIQEIASEACSIFKQYSVPLTNLSSTLEASS